MGTVSHQGITYDIWLFREDIHLQSSERDVIIKGGYRDVLQSAIEDKAIYVRGFRGCELDYNPIEVESRVADTIERYCLNYLTTHT